MPQLQQAARDREQQMMYTKDQGATRTDGQPNPLDFPNFSLFTVSDI